MSASPTPEQLYDLTLEQLRDLSARFVALPPIAKLHVFQTLLGSHAAIVAFTGKGDVFAETLALFAEAERNPQPFPLRGPSTPA